MRRDDAGTTRCPRSASRALTAVFSVAHNRKARDEVYFAAVRGYE